MMPLNSTAVPRVTAHYVGFEYRCPDCESWHNVNDGAVYAACPDCGRVVRLVVNQ